MLCKKKSKGTSSFGSLMTEIDIKLGCGVRYQEEVNTRTGCGQDSVKQQVIEQAGQNYHETK